MSKHIAYSSATSGDNARKEITKILRQFGCEEIGFADKFEAHEVLLYIRYRGREIQIPVSAKGWAAKYLRENPWKSTRRTSRAEYEHNALKQGHIAANSMLRDWIKGQITAIECGIHSFEAVFMPWMLVDGRPLNEQIAKLLPPPDAPKVVPLK